MNYSLLVPLEGDILGNAVTSINVRYTPSTYTTAEAEIAFKTTEFDSQPSIVRLVGSAMPALLNIRDNSLSKV